MLANEFRENLLSYLPNINKNQINIDNAYVLEYFICNANVTKALIAYIVKMDCIEHWTIRKILTNVDDFKSLNEIEESIPSIVKNLTSPIDAEIIINLNHLLVRLSITQCLYIVKYLDSLDSNYLNNLIACSTDDSKLLVYRLTSLMKAQLLSKIFSSTALTNIIKILGNH